MKKKLTILIPFCLVIFMAMAMAQIASAAEVSGDVEFDGKQLNIHYSQAEFQNALASLLPGEEASLTLSLSNNSDKTTDWYVENQVVKAFEEGIEASGGAYAYEILYIDQSGKKNVIYSNDKVGGEDSKGLYEATDSTDKYFYLTRLASGGMGVFKINIKIDGETVSNEYQNSIADINVNFGVEVVDEKAAPNDSDNTKTSDKTKKTSKKVTSTPSKTPHNLIKTGDDTKMTIYIMLFALAAIALCVVVFSWARERKGGSNEQNS